MRMQQRMREQKGIAGLTLVSILLTLCLALTLMSNRGLLLQIKQAQNQIQHSKNQWRAEGAIECAYSGLNIGISKESLLSECALLSEADISIIETEKGSHLLANASGTVILRSAAYIEAASSTEAFDKWQWNKGTWRDFN
jgi:hypothetical protein